MSCYFVRACGAAVCAVLFSSFTSLTFAAFIPSGPAVPLPALLLPGGSITAGDKLFENFTYFSTGDMPPATGVLVVPGADHLGNFGIRFVGAFFDLFSSPGGSVADITYKVTATDPGMLISDAHVVSDVSISGNGAAVVNETFLTQFEQEDLIILDTPGSTIRMAEVIFGVPVRSLEVQKNISFLAAELGSVAMASFVDQTFSQVPDPNQNEIAEPATLGLAGLASLFIGAIYMRRRLG